MIGQYCNTILRQLWSSESLTLRWGEYWYPGERHVMLSCLGSLRWSLSGLSCLHIHTGTPLRRTAAFCWFLDYNKLIPQVSGCRG